MPRLFFLKIFTLSLAAGSTFAASNPCVPEVPAYNATARIETEDSCHLWADVSFIYWQPSQDNMEIGLALESVSPVFFDGFYVAASVLDSKYINMDFDFLPGFKIGLGMDIPRDNWDWALEYTRLHGKDLKHSKGGAYGLAPSFADSESLDLLLGSSNTLSHGPGKVSWYIKLDFLDADLGRWFYSGTKLTLHPFFGMRGAWICQQLYGFYSRTPATLNIKAGLDSWGIGPRAGLDGHWKVGYGMRLYGNAAADLLYTRYDWKFNSSVLNPHVTTVPVKFISEEEGINAIRAHIDLELGFGWGSYFHRDKYHFDLSAGYAFQVFFNQNMFKFYFFTANAATSYAPNGNLYVQGITFKTKLDF